MGKKGKGRQCGRFDSKSQRAAFAQEIQQHIQQHTTSTTRATATTSKKRNSLFSSNSSGLRPRVTPQVTSQIKGMLRERQSYEAYNLLQRRRRAGFVLPPPTSQPLQLDHSKRSTMSHPPGWIINHPPPNPQQQQQLQQPDTRQQTPPSSIQSLQDLCLTILGDYFQDYFDAMGKESLHMALGFLPSETISQLSIMVSSCNGSKVNNDVAFVLGNHSHLQSLCLRAATTATSRRTNSSRTPKTLQDDQDEEEERQQQETLTDKGILALVPSLPSSHYDDDVADSSWEDIWDDDSDNEESSNVTNNEIRQRRRSQQQRPELDLLHHLQGCNLRLKRLELLQCSRLSANAVLALLEKCSSITHLSLAGTFNNTKSRPHTYYSCSNNNKNQNSQMPEEDGPRLVSSLPELLPNLQVLDLTQCDWATRDLLEETFVYRDCYSTSTAHQEQQCDEDEDEDDHLLMDQRTPPLVYYNQGSFLASSGGTNNSQNDHNVVANDW